MIDLRGIAVQGLGYENLSTAVQGFLPMTVIHPGSGGGPVRIEVRARRRDDEEIFMIIQAALMALTCR